jgi:hypothetical protein
MFEPDAELAAMFAADDDARAGLPEDEPPTWLVASSPAAELDEAQCLDRLIALERQLARIHSEQVQVLAAIEHADSSPKHWSQDVVMGTLRISSRAARRSSSSPRPWSKTCPEPWPCSNAATSAPGAQT